MGTIVLNTNGIGNELHGLGASLYIGGSSVNVTVVTVIGYFNSVPYFTYLPIQLAGFMPLTDCNFSDCRDSGSCERYYSPVFGDIGAPGAGYTNDVNGFYVNWANYVPSFSILKQVNGKMVSQVVISNNSYGKYYAQGTIPNQKNYAGFQVDWGKVVNAFGAGVYQIQVSQCSYSMVQASLIVPIVSWEGSQFYSGQFLIGLVVFNVSFYGTYANYLIYLAALINAQGRYTATVVAGVFTVFGTQGATDNNIQVSQTINDTSDSFKATSNTSQGNSGSPSPYVLATPTPYRFGVINYNNGSHYGGANNDTFTAINKQEAFTGMCEFWGNTCYAGEFVSCILSVNLKIAGATVYTLTFNAPINTQSVANFKFPLTGTNGIPSLNPGDLVTVEFSVAVTYNAGHGDSCGSATINNGLTGASYWQNTPGVQTITAWGTLAGGSTGGITCACAGISNYFRLKAWNCDLARNTIKIESAFQGGTLGDAYNPGNLFDLSGGFIFYDSIRIGGFTGNMEPKFDKVIDEFGASSNKPFGFMELVRDKIVPSYKLCAHAVPLYSFKGILYYGFMCPNLLISDYNSNNADWNIKQKPVILKGDVKPKYLNKGHFSKNLNWENRLVSFDALLEEGVQSGIMSSC